MICDSLFGEFIGELLFRMFPGVYEIVELGS